MSITPYQPTLPVEGQFTESELNFMEESPPGLFPENQDSNFGFIIRKLFCDRIDEISDQLTTIYNERFVETSTELLSDWEREVDLPVAPAGRSVVQRRADVLTRLQKGPFTRDRVKAVITRFLEVTQGETIQLTPAGVPLVAGGVPLYGETAPVSTLFRVYEDIRGFTYQVWIKNTVTPDMAALTRELDRITPSGLDYTIDNTKANVLSYFRTVLNKQPVWYGRMNTVEGFGDDTSGYAHDGTVNGTIATFGTPGPGLLDTAVDENAAGTGNGAGDFDGSTGYISIPHAAQLNVGDHFSLEALIRPDAIGAYQSIFDKGINSPAIYLYTDNKLRFERRGVTIIAESNITFVAGTTYHVVVTKSGSVVKIFIDGVDRTTLLTPDTCLNTTEPLIIGKNGAGVGGYFNGVIDEVAVYNYPLTHAEVLNNYNTGKNIA